MAAHQESHVAREDGRRERIVGLLRRELEARGEVELAVLHGSFQQGATYRDIDIALWLDPDRIPASERFRYALDLSVQLELQLGVTVDVRVLNDASLAFRRHALEGAPLVVRDQTFLDELRERTWDDYIDFEPFARQYLREATVSEVNLDRLRELAGHLRDAVRQLRELGGASRDVFVSDPRTTNAAKYLFIVAAEAALDICNHLAARRGARSPRDYADCMAIMAEIGVIDHDLRTRLMRMARLRHLLVHLYARVDDGEVYRVIGEDLGDLDRYLMSLGRYLKTEI